ncbi:uncharacterized protein LOC122073967 [Macadamia integrifolia]|uniref:uncharacterized protein LOC122073967 n=1 Tax=Macadamia integrifolia TaxID=60698 RepID=UPI001C4F6F27|nr:uncharacterized protein LOC122073967 [Macadamia integrifolia]
MEVSTGDCGKSELGCSNNGGSEESNPQYPEVESSDSGVRRSFAFEQEFHSMNALEILRETIRILRYDSSPFMVIAAILICPVSAVLLSHVLIDESIVKRLTIRLLLVARSTGLPLKPYIKQWCQRLAEMALVAAFSFPIYITFSLLSKAAVVYSVDCTYCRKRFDLSKFFSIIIKIWKRLISTYIWACMVIVGCLALFLVLIVVVCNIFSVIGFQSDLIVYPAVMVGLLFSVVFANAIIICNLAFVISVLEDISGPQALLRSSILIQGQTQVGLLLFLISTAGTTFVEGLFEHRVKTVSYGDGSSRIWEGPLLVMMHSFVALIDSMMSAVFYFICRSSSLEASEGEVEVMEVTSESVDSQ